MLDEVPSFWQTLVERVESLIQDLSSFLTSLRPAEDRVAFSIALIALCAKLAKADGRVTVEEIRVFRSILEIPLRDEVNAARVFNLCRQDTTGFEIYARQMNRLLGPGEVGDLRRLDVLEALFHIAMADGSYHQQEALFLNRVAEIFACPASAFRAMEARHVPEIWNPWTVLGLGTDATAAVVRTAWKRLVHENHPDQMMARGAPSEMIVLSNRRFADLMQAREEIERSLQAQNDEIDGPMQNGGA